MKKLLNVTFVFILFIFFGSFVKAEAKSSSISQNMLNYNGHYYFFYKDRKETWKEAEAACENMGGHLVTFTDIKECNAIWDYVCTIKEQCVWIGLYNAGTKNNPDWKWVNNEKTLFTNWRSGQPNYGYNNGLGYESYAAMGDYGSAFWDDYLENGAGNGMGYVCEWDSYEIDNLAPILLSADVEADKDVKYPDFYGVISPYNYGLSSIFYKEYSAEKDMIWIFRSNGFLSEDCWTSKYKYNIIDISNDINNRREQWASYYDTIFETWGVIYDQSPYYVVFLPKVEKSTYTFWYRIYDYSAIRRVDGYFRCLKWNKGHETLHHTSEAFDLFVYSLQIDIPESLNIGEEKEIQFASKLEDSCYDKPEPGLIWEWKSSDNSIVKLDDNGTITGMKPGKATISLVVNDNDVYSTDITVSQPSFPSKIELYCGEEENIAVQGIEQSIIEWSIKDADVASILKGKIIGNKAGTTSLIGKYGQNSFECKVTVVSNSISKSEIELYSGAKDQLTIKGLKNIKWHTSNPKVATVNDGEVNALKPGMAIISAEVGNQVLECKVIVPENTLSAESVEVVMGDNIDVYVLYSPVNETYISSDETVVTVKNGKLIAVGAGKATVSVKVGNDTLKCKVKVKKKPAPTGFEYESSSKTIKLKWNDYSDAASYSVYFYDNSKKDFKLIDTVKKAEYTANKLEAGKTYVFRIAANVKINGKLMEQALSEKIKCKTAKKDINGFQVIDGKTYYYKDGFRVVSGGLKKIDGSKYIFEDDGSLVKDAFTTINGSMYYSDSDGKVAVKTEVTDKKKKVTYVADKNGVLTEKKESTDSGKTDSTDKKTKTKTVTFNDVTLAIPKSWGSYTKDGDSIIYNFGSSICMIYTDPKDGSLTQKKADWLLDEFKEYCTTYLKVTDSKKTENKKSDISTYYIYYIDLGIPNSSGTKSTSCKGMLTAFEYKDKFYVAVIMVEKSEYKDSSFDGYNSVIKSVKPVTSSDNGSDKSGKTDKNGVNKDLKEFLDSYEAFLDDYAAFMKNYLKAAYSLDYLSMLDEYDKMVNKLEKYEKKFNELNPEMMSTADYKYYLESMGRIQKKLMNLYS